MPNIKITWVKSAIGYDRRQGGVIQALGLKRLNHTIEKEDTPSIRGMVAKVSHLVKVEQP